LTRSIHALTEQPCGRIPWTVIAIELPAPIGYERQQNPHRTSERARQMSEAGVDGDHEIERRDDGGSLREVGEELPARYQVASGSQRLRVARAKLRSAG